MTGHQSLANFEIKTEEKPDLGYNHDEHMVTLEIDTPVSEMEEAYLDTPDRVVKVQEFQEWVQRHNTDSMIQDIMIAHKVIDSGIPNRYGCRIPIQSNWRIENFRYKLGEYEDLEVLEWLQFGFPISRDADI